MMMMMTSEEDEIFMDYSDEEDELDDIQEGGGKPKPTTKTGEGDSKDPKKAAKGKGLMSKLSGLVSKGPKAATEASDAKEEEGKQGLLSKLPGLGLGLGKPKASAAAVETEATPDDGDGEEKKGAFGRMSKFLMKSEKGKTLVDKLQKFFKIILAIPRIIIAVFRALPFIWGSIWAFAMIMVVFVVLFLIAYIVYVTSPRAQLLWHSEDLDGYITKYKADLVESLQVLQSKYGSAAGMLSRVPGVDRSLIDVINGNMGSVVDNPSLDENLDSYLQFRKSLANSKNFMPKRDIRANARQFVDDEDEIDSLVKEFKTTFMKPLDRIVSATETLSDQLASRGIRLLRSQDIRSTGYSVDERGNKTADYVTYAADASNKSGTFWASTLTVSPTYEVLKRLPKIDDTSGMNAPEEVVSYVTAVHKIRMLMEQRKDIERMYMSRRKNLPFAIWTIYYAPLMENLWFSFIAYWKKFPKRAVRSFMGTIGWWFSLGPAIAVIPCNMAFTDPDERSQKCQSTIGGDEEESFSMPSEVDSDGNPRSDDARMDEVIENFINLGGIIKALSSIAAFFKNIGSIGEALGKLFMQFPTDPVGSIIRLISILVGMILGLVLMLIWILFTIVMFPLVLAFAVMWIYCITFGALYTLWLIILAILLAIPYFGLWLIDMPTGGFITRLMHCENSPGEWHTRNMISDDNAYIRYFPFCTGPCGSRYTVSWSGCCCDKLPDYMPDMCPQQQIYNFATGNGGSMFNPMSGPFAIAKYSPDSKFYNKSVQQKRKFLISVLKKKVKWYQRCYDKLGNKDYLNRHLCTVFDMLGIKENSILSKLAVVCDECYCNYRSNDSATSTGGARMTDEGYQDEGDGGNESLCRDIKRQAAGGKSDPSNQPGPQLLRKALILTLITLCGMLALYSMAQSGNKLLS